MEIVVDRVSVDEEKGEITIFFRVDCVPFIKVIDCKKLVGRR